MATLTGGGTIDSVGLTEAQNTIVSNLLQTQFSTVTSVSNTEIVATNTNTNTTPVLLGTFQASSVVTQTVSSPTDGGLAVVNTDKSASGGSNTVTNVVVDDKAGGLLLSGGGNVNTVTGVILGASSSTSLIVGNAGTQVIDGSKSTQNMNILTGTGNDTVVSGSGNDIVTFGDAGIANGGGGADTLIGGSGTATLGGGAGADSIVAATGGGVLIGEVGNDTMVGGAGKDIFIYTSNGGNDVISGFDPASDTLGLANFSDISGAGLSLVDIINRATVSGGNTILTMPDGSTITLAGVTGINVNWFTVK